MAYWLMKSEPSVYAWDRLRREGRTDWNGVRNFLARRHLMSMKVNDRAFFYHSNEGREIVGIMRITACAYPDPSDATGRFVQVDVAPVMPLKQPVTLDQIRAEPALADMALLRLSRLSVQPVTAAQWKKICRMGGCPDA